MLRLIIRFLENVESHVLEQQKRIVLNTSTTISRQVFKENSSLIETIKYNRFILHYFKFYLMFETFICQHYLSMEMWELLSETSHLVPIVFGGVNYVDLLPQDAYIDALNHSPASLAGTIFFLSRNKQVLFY